MKYYLIIFLLIANISSYPQEYSLLLGLGYENECKIGNIDAGFMQNLKTICVTTENDSLKIIADIPELILKRDTSYWRIGIKRSVYNRCTKDLLWVSPLGTEPDIKGIDVDCGENCDLYEEYEINYANEKYIVVTNSGEGSCRESAHPSSWHDYYWILIDNFAKKYDWIGDLALNIPDDIPKIFNKAFYENFLKDGKKVYDTLDKETKRALEETPSKVYLMRQNGKWHSGGEYYWNSEVDRGTTAEFEVSTLPPYSLVGYDSLSIPWDTIKTYIPNANDAITSPDGKVLVVIVGRSLNVYNLINSEIPSSPSIKYEIKGSGLNIISIKWFRDDGKTSSFLKNLSEDFWRYPHSISSLY